MRFLQKFLFLFKSKYRRKWQWELRRVFCDDQILLPQSLPLRGLRIVILNCFLIINLSLLTAIEGTENVNSNPNSNISTINTRPSNQPLSNCLVPSSDYFGEAEIPPCFNNGVCVNDTCRCNPGWSGKFCEHCSGKVR